MAEILYGPWTEKRDEILASPDQFKASQQSLLEPMIEAQQALLSASHPFKATCDIRPFHCRKVLNALEDIITNVSIFCKLLSDTSLLPLFISSFRYPLLASLHRFQEQASNLIVLIENYRIHYQSRKYYTSQKRHDIYKAVEHLSRDLQGFFTEIDFLATEIRFQEAKLTPTTQNVDPHLHFVDSLEEDRC